MLRVMRKLIKSWITPEEEKIEFLRKKLNDYFFTVYLSRLIGTDSETAVQVPAFLIERHARELATERTKIELEKVITECRVARCYKNAI